MTHSIFLLAAEAAEKSGGLFNLDATLLVIAVQFLVLVAILNATFFKPLTKAMDERGDYVRGNFAEAKDRLHKAEQLAQQYEQELASTRKQAQAIITNAQAEAQKIRSQRIATAMEEAQAQVRNAKLEIEQQKQSASAALEGQVETLSRQIIERLLGNLANG